MRPSLAVLLVIEAAIIAQAMGLEDEHSSSSTEVFDLGHLVDDAQQFVQGAKPQDAGTTALQRIEAMKNRLAARMLNKEIAKIPYTETELGEGMAVKAVKGKKVQKAYNSFKRFSKTLVAQKEELRKKVLKAEAKQTKAEKEQLKAKKASAELRKKLRGKVSKKKAGKIALGLKKFKKRVKLLKKKLLATKKAHAKAVKLSKSKFKKFKKETRAQYDKDKKQLAAMREAELQEFKKYRQQVGKKWYVDTTRLTKWKRKLAGSRDKIKDLEGEVNNNDRLFKEMQAGLKQRYLLKEQHALKKQGRKLSKQKAATKGEQQKEKWDKQKVERAKSNEKKDNTEMMKAVKQSSKVGKTARKAKRDLKSLKKFEKAEMKQSKRKINNLKLKDDLEKVKENTAETKISSVRARALQKNKRVAKGEKKALQNLKSKEASKFRKLKRKMQQMQSAYAAKERVTKADVQKQYTKLRLAKDKQMDRVKQEAIRKETQAAKYRTKAKDEERKIARVKGRLAKEKRQVKRVEAQEKKEQRFFKKKIKKDTARIRKRAGARVVAAATTKSLKGARAAIAIKNAALKRAVKRTKKLAKHNDRLQRIADKYKRKLKHAEFRVYQAKKKHQKLQLSLKKMQLKYRMASKHAKNEEMLGEAGDTKDGENIMEKRYKAQLKETEAIGQRLQGLQAKTALSFSRSQKWEATAKKYKMTMLAALAHARRIADRVRKEWATKLIKEQDRHTKELQALKHRMETRQGEFDQKLVKLNSAKDSAMRTADKATASAGNQGELTTYIAGLVAQQEVRGRVLRKYMTNMANIRKKYNKKLGQEWKDEIARLKKQLAAYKNGREITKLKYRIMKLKSKGRKDKKRKRIKMEIKRAQNLDINTLLHAAISRAQRGSKNRSAAENRKRVTNAVNAVVKVVMGADRKKGKKLAKRAIRDPVGSQPPSQQADMQATIERLRKQNSALQKKLSSVANKAPGQTELPQQKADEAASQSFNPKKIAAKAATRLKTKQQKLWKRLHNMIRMSQLPQGNRVKKTSQRQGLTSLQKEIHSEPSMLGQSSPISPTLSPNMDYELEKLGQLQRGALLPSQEESTSEEDLQH